MNIKSNEDDKELVTITLNEDDMKEFEDYFEIEKPRRNENYNMDMFIDEVVKIYLYNNIQENINKEIMEKFKEIDAIHDEIKKLQHERSKAFEDEMKLRNKIESERIY